MIAGWLNKNRSPIGLDIGSSHLRMMQLSHHGQGWAVVAAACVPLPADLPDQGTSRNTQLAALIKQQLAEHPFKGRRVVSALPLASLVCKNLRLPRMPREELTAAVEWEASDRLHLSPQNMQLQFLDAGEVRQGEETRHEIILLAAPNQIISEHLDLLTACDLTPVAIDAAPGALARCVNNGQENPADENVKVVLDVGYRQSKITMTRAGRILFFKVIELGGKDFDQTVAQQLKLPLKDAIDLRRTTGNEPMEMPRGESADALFVSSKRENISRAVYESLRSSAGELAKEVGLCLRYYSVTFRGKRPEELLLVGGESHDPHLARILADGAGIEVHACPVLSKLDCTAMPSLQENDADLGQWAMAAGLSMRHETLLSMRGAA